MDLTRRETLLAAAFFLAAPHRSFAAAPVKRSPRDDKLLVSILLRGGADGLQLAPAIGEPGYRKLRASLHPGDGLALGSGFVLHPALEALAPAVDAKRLALIPAVGLPAPTRSHFEAQDRLEWGLSDARKGDTGWLGRALAASEAPVESPLDALAIAPTLPLALRGSSSLALEVPAQLGLASVSRAALGEIEVGFRRGGDEASRAGLEALELWDLLRPALRDGDPGRGFATRARGRVRLSLTASVEQAIALDEGGFAVSHLWLESDGWDTHRGQGPAAEWAIADLGAALALLWTHYGSTRDLQVVVSSEFGRALRPNGSGGTDHGTGSAALVLGSRVRGGVAGPWPGLSESALFEGRDVAPALDIRQVYAEVLEAHPGQPLDPAVFPGLERVSLGLFETPSF